MGQDAAPVPVWPGRPDAVGLRSPARWPSAAVGALAGAAVAVGVAAAWIPVRTAQPNVLVALALVVVITAIGASGRRPAVIAAALGAAAAFTFFDTEPYDRFAISRQPDLETAISLVVVGIITGELAVRVARQRRAESSAAGDLGRVRQASSLLALGEELVVMIGAVAAQLIGVLELRDCWYLTEPLAPATAVIDRNGVVGPGRADEVALPVWGLGQVLGHFLLQPGVAVSHWRHDQLLVAVTLADQVGAALAAQAPVPPPEPDDTSPRPEPRTPHLRVIP